MSYLIFYHVPDKKYDYTEFQTWEEAVEFLKKCQESVDGGMSFEIKRSIA